MSTDTERQVEVDISLTVADLYRFSMRHNYTHASGLLGLLLSLGALVFLFLNFKDFDSMAVLTLLIIGLSFTVIQPIMLYQKAHRQIKRTGSFAKPLHYTVNIEGIRVSQNEQVVIIEWPEVRKLVAAKKAIYIYMSPIRAFIFPVNQCDGQEKKLKDIVEECMAKVRSGEIVFTDRYHKEVEKAKNGE